MRLLLIVSGGIAAYKALDFVREARRSGYLVRTILTKGGAEFITPLSLAALSGEKTYTDLFSLTDESEMGHIRLSREADLILVVPASADLIAKMAHGLADDLASTLLLAANKPVLIAPAMNAEMWRHAAVKANIAILQSRNVQIIGPASGDLACGEVGEGRLVDINDILLASDQILGRKRWLRGLSALVTSGPTHEPIDPVRFIANRSSGKQGHAIARALSFAGAKTVLITGPVHLDDPVGCRTIKVETAQEMLAACQKELPVDLAVCAAAIADWRVDASTQKIKKSNNAPPRLDFQPNPDILATLSARGEKRPALVVGFAAESENVLQNAKEKRTRKGCDWMLANDTKAVFSQDDNQVTLLSDGQEEYWPRTSKDEIAHRLVEKIARHFSRQDVSDPGSDRTI